ncbi:MAG TPA: hypothetical protein PK765_03920 [bacterium]|nr:hypothetical protein [bacterium]
MKRIVLTIVLLLLSVSVKNVHAETGNIVMEKGISKEEVVNIVNEEIGYKLLEAEKNLEEKIHDGYQQAVDSTTSIANNSFSAQ